MRRHTTLFVGKDDHEFLWTWARELEQAVDFRVCPDHLLAVIVAELREMRSQLSLFRLPTEIEARAINLARADRDELSARLTAASRQREVQKRAQAISTARIRRPPDGQEFRGVSPVLSGLRIRAIDDIIPEPLEQEIAYADAAQS